MFELMLVISDWKTRKTTIFFRDSCNKEYSITLPDDGTPTEHGKAVIREINGLIAKLDKVYID